jgi:hypothetical protein
MKILRYALPMLAALVVPTLPLQAAGGQDASLPGKTPAVLFILRHAEKPVGDDKSPDLSPVGFMRARALPSLFVAAPGSNKLPRFPHPNFLFASAPAKHSNRPLETITPLAQALNLRVNTDFADLETAQIAKRILSGAYAGKFVLICWHHGEIPQLAKAFGVAHVPHSWDQDVFDQIWEIQWIDGKPQMVVLPQRLLPGDAQR